MKFTDLLLHVCLVGRNRTKLRIDILIHRVQFIYNLWIKNTLTDCLGLNFVVVVSIDVLILSIWEVSVVRCWLVIVVDLLFLFRVVLSPS